MMSGTSPHLTLEELTGHATGVSPAAASQEHLATCVACQAEVRRWNAVAGGTRLLAATSPPSPGLIDGVLAAINGAAPPTSSASRRRSLAGRPGVALASAAAVVLVVAAAYGLSSVFGAASQPTDGGGASGSEAVLAAELVDTDCTTLKVAAGTLQSTNGSDLVLRTENGKSVTVTTTGSTEITQQVTGDLSDITNGTRVFVTGQGTDSGDAITAEHVAVLPSSVRPPDPPRDPPRDLGRMMAMHGHANGTVTDVSGTGFTVVRDDDTEIRVTTSSSTTVIKQANVGPSELEEGRFTVAVGSPRADGTLAATTVQQNTLSDDASFSLPRELPTPPRELPRPPGELPNDLPRLGGRPSGLPKPPDGPRDLFKGLGCDSNAIANTALLSAGG